MVEILRNKNQATRLQILAEIADSGPYIQQRDIARRLNVTPQAISDYMGQLVKDGYIIPDGHSCYRVTNQGINWIIKVLKEIKEYSDFIVESITSFSICAAVAETDLLKGQKVGLKMKDGLLYATSQAGQGATGTIFSAAQAGEDAGIKDIEGIVDLDTGKVTIVKIPSIQRGGSKGADLIRLKKSLERKHPVGAIGIEAMVALDLAGAPAGYIFGVKEAAVEAAQHGLNPVVACVEDEISGLIKRLEEKAVSYDLIDLVNKASGSGTREART
jgi:putative transcriptional regulator